MPFRAYQYKRLKFETPHIRLVVIKPSLFSDKIECQLDIYPLSDLPVYEALSYVWGDPTGRNEIIVDDCSLPVTRNLYNALQALRRDTLRTLWIDAICVNQKDLQERSSQVQMMRHVYQNAVGVVAYLGEATPASDAAFGLIKRIDAGNYFADNEDEQAVQAEKDKILKILLSSSSHQGYLALSLDVALRPWFQRVWVIQEIAVANSVTLQCGRATVPLSEYTSLVYWIAAICQQLPDADNFDHLRVMHTGQIGHTHQLLKASNSMSIADLVYEYRTCGATDPRDKVFALLGLANDIDRKDALFTPNYSQSVTKVEVYIMLLEHYIQRFQRLDLICAQRRYDLPQGWPSWLPDWSPATSTPPQVYESFFNDDYIEGWSLTTLPLIGNYTAPCNSLSWTASANIASQASIIKSPPTLLAQGLVIDTIRDLGEAYSRVGDSQAVEDFNNCTMYTWEAAFLRNFGVQRTAKTGIIFNISDQCDRLSRAVDREGTTPRLSVLRKMYKHISWPVSLSRVRMRTRLAKEYSQVSFTTDKAKQGIRSPKIGGGEYIRGGDLVEAYLNTLFHDTFFEGPRGDAYARKVFCDASTWSTAFKDNRDRFRDWTASFQNHIIHRQFMVTEKGYMGTATFNAKKGDVLVVLYGCSVPVLLRKVEDYFTFVGECYVQGLMDGEAMKMSGEHECEEREFRLR